MPHILSMYDSDYLHHYDLPADEVDVEIESVTMTELTGQGGRKSKKPLLRFKGATKAFAICKTDARTLIALFGTPKSEDYVGKRITLMRSMTTMSGAPTECIRIKPTLPKAAK